jgi:hypothetical protein
MSAALLYLVGGPARSGKSVLAGRLLRERSVPYFSLDYLTTALAAGVPGLDVHHHQTPRDRAARLWPVVEPLLRHLAEVEPSYLVEGEAILPSLLAPLLTEYPAIIRPCFLGYAHCRVEAKVVAIQRYPSQVNDWVAGLGRTALEDLVLEMRVFSAELETECSQAQIPYCDGSADFEGALADAQRILLGAA